MTRFRFRAPQGVALLLATLSLSGCEYAQNLLFGGRAAPEAPMIGAPRPIQPPPIATKPPSVAIAPKAPELKPPAAPAPLVIAAPTAPPQPVAPQLTIAPPLVAAPPLQAPPAGAEFVRTPAGRLIAILPLEGAPPDRAYMIRESLSGAMGARISRDDFMAAPQGYRLEGRASIEGGAMLLDWRLMDAVGRTADQAFERQPLAPGAGDPWSRLTDEALKAVARRGAERLARGKSGASAGVPVAAPAPAAVAAPAVPGVMSAVIPPGVIVTEAAPAPLPTPAMKPPLMAAPPAPPAPSAPLALAPAPSAPPAAPKSADFSIGLAGGAAPPALKPPSVVAAPVAPALGAPMLAAPSTPARPPSTGTAPPLRLEPAAPPKPAPLPLAAAPPSPAPAVNAPIAFRGVFGAPGDGDQSLAAALRDMLQRSGETLVPEGAPGAMILAAQADKKPGPQGGDLVSIIWRLEDSQGASVGQVTQENEVPKGALDGAWREDAAMAAEGARDGVMELINAARKGAR